MPDQTTPAPAPSIKVITCNYTGEPVTGCTRTMRIVVNAGDPRAVKFATTFGAVFDRLLHWAQLCGLLETAHGVALDEGVAVLVFGYRRRPATPGVDPDTPQGWAWYRLNPDGTPGGILRRELVPEFFGPGVEYDLPPECRVCDLDPWPRG